MLHATQDACAQIVRTRNSYTHYALSLVLLRMPRWPCLDFAGARTMRTRVTRREKPPNSLPPYYLQSCTANHQHYGALR